MIIYTAKIEEWESLKEQDEFTDERYESEGFIHCSYPKQTCWVLNKHYKEEKEMLLLCIDTNKLKAAWKSEDLKGVGEEFPHVYGKMNREAIVQVIKIQRAQDGSYYENVDLKKLM